MYSYGTSEAERLRAGGGVTGWDLAVMGVFCGVGVTVVSDILIEGFLGAAFGMSVISTSSVFSFLIWELTLLFPFVPTAPEFAASDSATEASFSLRGANVKFEK